MVSVGVTVGAMLAEAEGIVRAEAEAEAEAVVDMIACLERTREVEDRRDHGTETRVATAITRGKDSNSDLALISVFSAMLLRVALTATKTGSSTQEKGTIASSYMYPRKNLIYFINSM